SSSLLAFATRRSSDLERLPVSGAGAAARRRGPRGRWRSRRRRALFRTRATHANPDLISDRRLVSKWTKQRREVVGLRRAAASSRSEEHTSELQSLRHL